MMIHPSAVIHPTAIVLEGANVGAGVEIGPYSIIGSNVAIGERCWIGPHVVIEGHTTIGCDNRIYQFSSIGAAPQDKKYDGEPTCLQIGDRNVIREHCTFNTGTTQDGSVTRVGDDNWIMACVHIAHDCQVGNNTTFANHATLAGHVTVGDWVILGGFTGVHQFCRVGAHAFCGVGTVLVQDLPPFVTVAGSPAKPHGINSEGLRRRGYSAGAIAAIKRAYRALYRKGLSLDDARQEITSIVAEQEEVGLFSDFISQSGRGLVR